jgi:hypothetical protein
VPVAVGGLKNGGPMLRRKLNRFRTARNAALLVMAMFALLTVAPPLHTADADDSDVFKVRIKGFWFYSSPSGDIPGATETSRTNLQKNLGFINYSTFTGKLDWKSTHNNHLYVKVSPFNQTRRNVLPRTIVFQGQTFSLELVTESQLKSSLYASDYQYDIVRRKRGHLGLAAQIDLFDLPASLNVAAQVTSDGLQHAAVSAKLSVVG